MSCVVTPANSSNDTGWPGFVLNSAKSGSKSPSEGAIPWHLTHACQEVHVFDRGSSVLVLYTVQFCCRAQLRNVAYTRFVVFELWGSKTESLILCILCRWVCLSTLRDLVGICRRSCGSVVKMYAYIFPQISHLEHFNKTFKYLIQIGGGSLYL